MPTYAYKCKRCEYEFEEFQSIKADSLTMCPSCNTSSLSRMIGGGSGLIFKGSGFYLTDYKKSNSSPAGGNNKPSKTEDANKSEVKTTPKDTSSEKPISAEKK